MSALEQPTVTPPVVDRALFDQALAVQVAAEKEVTRHGDRVSAARRRLPVVAVEDYASTGEDGPVRLGELFGDGHVLLVQNVVFDPSWERGCPSCTWAVDTLPAAMGRLAEESITFAMVSRAPVDRLAAWRAERRWPHRWVSSHGTTYHHGWGWTVTDEHGQEGQRPGCSHYLLSDGTPHLTYATTARGTEAILPMAHIVDLTVYGRRQDREDSPPGWPQAPTCG